MPSLSSGYVSDDGALSLIAGDAKLAGVPVYSVVLDFLRHFAQIGRFFPVHVLTVYNFVITPTLASYKVSKLVTVVLSLAVWGRFVWRVSGSSRIAALAIVLVGTLTEYRLYHDAVLGFGWMLPLALSLEMGSLLFQLDHRDRGDRWRLVVSAALFALAAMTYEVCVALLPLHVYLALRGRTGRFRVASLPQALPHTVVALALVLLVVVLRSRAGFTPNPDYVPALSLAAVTSVLKQSLGSLPLAYRFLDPNDLFAPGHLLTDVTVAQCLVSAAAGFTVWRILRDEGARRAPLAPLAWLGAALWVLPGVPVALSPKYQRELRLGLTYLPVYFALCGVALSALALVLAIARRTSERGITRLAAASAALVASGAFVVQADNRRVVANLDVEWLYPRSLLETGAKRGFFSPLRDGDNVVIESGIADAPWETRAFFMLHAGVRLRGVGRWPLQLSGFPGGDAPDARVQRAFDDGSGPWWLAYFSSDPEEGYALLSRLSFIDATQRDMHAAYGHAVTLMLRLPSPGDSRRGMGYFARQDGFVSVTYRARGPAPDRPWTLRRRSAACGAAAPHMTCTARGEGFQLWRLDEGADVIDLDSITVATARYGDAPR